MTKLVAPDKGVKETDIGHRRYKVDRGGLYSVESKSDIKAMKAEGYFEASLNPVTHGDRNRGFTCVQCGFNGWFRKCGRCGIESEAIATDGE
jgi:hypothetical protein